MIQHGAKDQTIYMYHLTTRYINTAVIQYSVLYIYAQVIGIPLEVCSSVATCRECVELNDPLCGWCVIEGKCSRSSQCQDSNMAERYLTEDRCFNNITVDPTIYTIDLQSPPHEVCIIYHDQAILDEILNGNIEAKFLNFLYHVLRKYLM